VTLGALTCDSWCPDLTSVVASARSGHLDSQSLGPHFLQLSSQIVFNCIFTYRNYPVLYSIVLERDTSCISSVSFCLFTLENNKEMAAQCYVSNYILICLHTQMSFNVTCYCNWCCNVYI
jgi:hypothetical protein